MKAPSLLLGIAVGAVAALSVMFFLQPKGSQQ